jgi:hypothetical protein
MPNNPMRDFCQRRNTHKFFVAARREEDSHKKTFSPPLLIGGRSFVKGDNLIKIKLTGTLKTYKAIVVTSDEEIPDDYTAIAGMHFEGNDISIAVPSCLIEKKKIINKLSNQAEGCLIEAIPEHNEHSETD